MPTIKSLQINYAVEEPHIMSKIFWSIPNAYSNLRSFRYFGKTISEEDIEALKHLEHLREFYLLEDCYIEGRHFCDLHSLEVLVIHSHLIRFKYLEELLRRSIKILRKLTLDLEEYDDNDLNRLFAIIREGSLTGIDLKYCNKSERRAFRISR